MSPLLPVRTKLQAYLELQKQLQAMSVEQQAEHNGPADALRDKMDDVWLKLSDADIAWLDAQKSPT